MRLSLLLIAIALLSACSDDSPPTESSATPPTAPVAQAPAAGQAVPAEKADFAAADVAEPEEGADPCDLSGYDMSKMTVELHENLVKACDRSKQ